jgi:regulator of sigma E protease
METLMGYLGILIVFGTIIVIHELGHFLVAKWSGMTVHEFAVGFGPVLFSRVKGGTRYSVRLLPFGGFVRIAGMEPGEETEPNGFYTKPFRSKFATIIAGVTMNVLLALIIFIVIGMFIGKPTDTPVIRRVVADMPAAKAGLQKNDRIVRVGTEENPTILRSIEVINDSKSAVAIVVLRNGERVTKSVTPVPLQGGRKIGVELGSVYQKIGVGESITNGFVTTYRATHAMIMGIGMLFTGQAPPGSLTGAVGISRIIYDAASADLLSPENMSWFLLLFALISLNIAIVNLLPIPALDGSHLVILVLERIRGKEFDPEKKALVHTVGFVLLLGLLVLIIGNDIWNWIAGKPPIPGR